MRSNDDLDPDGMEKEEEEEEERKKEEEGRGRRLEGMERGEGQVTWRAKV
jgi:hypothetical protein